MRLALFACVFIIIRLTIAIVGKLVLPKDASINHSTEVPSSPLSALLLGLPLAVGSYSSLPALGLG